MFLLDANTLIEAKDHYYRMATCPGFWDWLLRAHAKGQLASIDAVARELRRGNDQLAEWAKQHATLFLPESDAATQAAFAEIAEHAVARAARMKAGALEDFLSGADPWLIAKARATGAVVATREKFSADVRRRFLIPNVCREFNVECIDTFDLLERLGARFVLAD